MAPVDTPTLVFDGACGFCTAAVRWLSPRLERPVRIAPWQTADLSALGLSTDEARRSLWWIEPSGARLEAADAVAAALCTCRAPWRELGRLLRVPGLRALADAGYALVARHRHRLPGTTPAHRDGDAPSCGRR